MGFDGYRARVAAVCNTVTRKASLPGFGGCMPIPALCDRIPVHNNLLVIDSGKAHRASCVYSACAIPVPNMRRGLAKGEIEGGLSCTEARGAGVMPARCALCGIDEALGHGRAGQCASGLHCIPEQGSPARFIACSKLSANIGKAVRGWEMEESSTPFGSLLV